MLKRSSKESVQEMIQEYRLGSSLKQVARRFEVDWTTVRWHVNRAGAMRSSDDAYFLRDQSNQDARSARG